MAPSTETISDVGRQCLRLKMTEHVGPITFGKLIEYFGTADAVLEASAAELQAIPGLGATKTRGMVNSRWSADVDAEVEQAKQAGVRIICRLDADYPEPLMHTPDPPICLYVQGKLERTDAVAVAVVGSRNCSHYGHEQARRFGYLLAQAGITVVSGMARGIDSCAHTGALEADGRTIAVLGNGLAHTYPPEHEPLRARIAEHGAVISELSMDTDAAESTFPSRNRIIAGLCLGTLVVEAGHRSGALITASLATDYDREVFAVPGRVDVPTAAGVNALIRESKAKLVSGLQDILDELRGVGEVLVQERAEGKPVLDPTESTVFGYLKAGEYDLDEIIRDTNLSAAQVGSALTMLQLKSLVKQLPGNRYARAGKL